MYRNFSILVAVLLIGSENAQSTEKHEYTMIEFICKKQPMLSVCRRGLRSFNSNDVKFNDDDPMPTPGPLLNDTQRAPYDVAVKRREEPENEEKNWEERKKIQIRTTTRRPNLDDELIKSIEEFDRTTIESTTAESTTTSQTTTDDRSEETTTDWPSTSTELQTTEKPETFEPMNAQQRYQQEIRRYLKRYKSYFHQYPQAAAYYPSPERYEKQLNQYFYQQQPQTRQFYYPSQQVYQQPERSNVFYQPQQQYYSPQQQSWSSPQSNYYQPGGFNFGIGSQLQIPYAGPLGISSGFGFSGRK
ncbi:hypothetical protein M3Y98_00757300 [Aphelenchoides besseyi]|nr:hypothetical protein M3Y98_00757300 [Aphelenchoides besseyi]